jgi:large subunit ribosomal protein L10
MSKYVKNLITDHLRERLSGVDDALLVDVIGMDANANNRLRAELAEKNINLLVVKNSLAARATMGTPLGPMFEGLTGSSALCWGSEDVVSLAKEVVRLAKQDAYAPFEAKGGVMDGDPLTAEQVQQVSKWPSREEQLSMLIGQILGPGAVLSGQLIGPGGTLAGQIAQKAEGEAEDTDS